MKRIVLAPDAPLPYSFFERRVSDYQKANVMSRHAAMSRTASLNPIGEASGSSTPHDDRSGLVLDADF